MPPRPMVPTMVICLQLTKGLHHGLTTLMYVCYTGSRNPLPALPQQTLTDRGLFFPKNVMG